MTSWLEPLIDPHELAVAAQRGDSKRQAGLALLLSGQLFVYERLAGEAGWPRVGQRPRASATLEEQLLAVVGLHLTGGRGVSAAYEALARRRPKETAFATAVAVLHSLYLADQGERDKAIQVLHEPLQRKATPLDRMLLGLHIGVREAEQGRLDRAIEATERARGLHAAPRERRQHRALRTIAQHNLFHYRQQSGKLTDPFRLPLRGSELPLLRGALDISTGLARYLEDQFEQATQDPYSRSIVWRAEDPVEMPLVGALLRSECLADWAEQRHARALLGRYYVASKLGTREGVTKSAFDLLRRAGDYKGMQAAARSVAAIGPVGSLRAAARAVVDRPWPRPEEASILALFSESADLLEGRDAGHVLSRLGSALEVVARNAPVGLRALARILRSASDTTQTSGARAARVLAQEWEHPLILQRLGQVVEALRWPVVSAAERKRWIAYVDEHLLDDGDQRLLAERAAGALTGVEREVVSELLLEAYKKRPSVDRLALLTDADVPLPRDIRGKALDEVAETLEDIRRQARGGTYGLGGTDLALLMLSLIRRRPDDIHWDTLLEFLVDGEVSIDAKIRALAELASPSVAIPSRIQAELRKQLRTVTGQADPLAASPNVLRGVTLRLWLKVGGLERDELLSRLLQLAGDLDSDARREAALTLPAAQRRLGDDSTFTLGLTLTRDRDFSVRSAAARSLAQLRRERAAELGLLASERLEDLLAEPGTEIPHETLAGLIEAQRKGHPPDRAVMDQVRRLDRSHPSRRVQTLAALLIEEATRESLGRRDQPTKQP